MSERKQTLRDVTASPAEADELRRTQRELIDREARLKAILDTAVDGIITIDEHGVIESVNAATERIFGYARQELVGRNVSLLMPSPYREEHDRYIADYLRTGEKKIIGIGRDAEGRRKDGSRLPINLAVSEVRVHGKRLFTGLVRDISDRRHAEDRARRRLEELTHAARLSTLGELTTGIAHEVNQPLAAIVSFAEACLRMLRSGKAAPEKLEDALEQIAAQGQRAGQIIQHLRRLARKDESERTRIDLNQVVEVVLGLVTNELDAHGIRVQRKLETGLPPVDCNRIQIEQVVLNLVRNAMDAVQTLSPGDRRITIVTARHEGPLVELTVEDTGEGFAGDNVEQIFETFYTTKPAGLGMGLSISRSIVEDHGGRLWANARPGGGAAFHVTLPVGKGIDV